MQNLPLAFYTDYTDHQPFKVTLFARIHEMKGMIHELHQVGQLPEAEKKNWLSENEALLEKYLENFSHHAPVELTMNEMDGELSQLLVEYTAYVQDLLKVTKTILSVNQKKTKKTSQKLS